MEIAFENDLPLVSLVQSVSLLYRESVQENSLNGSGWGFPPSTISRLP